MAQVHSTVTDAWGSRQQAPPNNGRIPFLLPPSAKPTDMETTTEMWELAKESADKLAVIAATLSAKEAQDMSRNRWKMPLIKLLGELAGNLQRVSFVHNKFEQRHNSLGEVEQLLEGMEQLCIFRVSRALNPGQVMANPYPAAPADNRRPQSQPRKSLLSHPQRSKSMDLWRRIDTCQHDRSQLESLCLNRSRTWRQRTGPPQACSLSLVQYQNAAQPCQEILRFS